MYKKIIPNNAAMYCLLHKLPCVVYYVRDRGVSSGRDCNNVTLYNIILYTLYKRIHVYNGVYCSLLPHSIKQRLLYISP